ncbi:MAG: ABC transporter ATP-binding protein [Rhodobiaceae bacterium]|nr:ABC transporter ATP-binding protein [Rhodobiaceae bacterium]MCC0054219.1 ABC transporter ATP-binding protein [Rhodobiaceae bacterium]
MSAAPDMLRIEALDAWYARAQVLFGVDLALKRGEVLAMIGRNGAGKSTLMKAVMGLATAKARAITFDGVGIAGLPAHRIARAGLGYVPEERRIFTNLTVAENLETGRRPARPGVDAWTPARIFELFPNLAGMQHRSAREMSGGEQQMLAVARTLMGNPKALLLDEPSEGLAPVIVDAMADAVMALKREGLSIVLSEQNLRFAGLVCDAAVVLSSGSLTYAGPLRPLLDDHDLLEDKLGL